MDGQAIRRRDWRRPAGRHHASDFDTPLPRVQVTESGESGEMTPGRGRTGETRGETGQRVRGCTHTHTCMKAPLTCCSRNRKQTVWGTAHRPDAPERGRCHDRWRLLRATSGTLSGTPVWPEADAPVSGVSVCLLHCETSAAPWPLPIKSATECGGGGTALSPCIRRYRTFLVTPISKHTQHGTERPRPPKHHILSRIHTYLHNTHPSIQTPLCKHPPPPPCSGQKPAHLQAGAEPTHLLPHIPPPPSYLFNIPSINMAMRRQPISLPPPVSFERGRPYPARRASDSDSSMFRPPAQRSTWVTAPRNHSASP